MSSPDLVAVNRTFYDALWRHARLQRPERFNTWPAISALLPAARTRLELGAGLKPRLPIAGTHFVDLSSRAAGELAARGGLAAVGQINDLPFRDQQFDLVCAFDVIEHVADDRRVFHELSRVLKDGGVLIFSVPIHQALWTEFDDWVGHARRYNPDELMATLVRNGLTLERSAVFGMAPTNPRWLKAGMWWLERYRGWAMFWYNWVGLPLALAFQKPLHLADGLIGTAGVDELLLVCRRANAARASGTA